MGTARQKDCRAVSLASGLPELSVIDVISLLLHFLADLLQVFSESLPGIASGQGEG